MIEIDFDVIVEIPEEEIRRKEEMKIRMAEKLRETIERRKEIKKKMHEHELNQLQELKEKYENGDKAAHEEVVEMFGTNKFFDKLLKKIHSLQVKLGWAE
jgi:type I site-specific restriction-modification system R (restriction) subunit